MTPPESIMSGDPFNMTLSELIETLMRDRWAGAHALRGEYPRLVVIPADEFASYSATVDRRHQIVVIPGGAGVADVVYVCIKNAANTYTWLDISTSYTAITGSSTSDLKDNMVANGLVANGGATPLNLDSGDLFCNDVTAASVITSAGLIHSGVLGLFGAPTTTKLTVTGSRGGNDALASLLAKLAVYGLITDSTT